MLKGLPISRLTVTFLLGACLCGLTLFSGCQSASDFQVKDLAKTDINQVSEIHMNQAVALMKTLTEKLYKKNPNELKKNPGQTIQSRIEQIFSCPSAGPFTELSTQSGTDAILLGFEPGFTGDRVFAVMFGLHSMLRQAYNDKCELFMLDFLNEQSLYNSARNIEILVWRLKTRTNENGELFLLTNSQDNLSYERLFGKLISLQDTMARIVSRRTGRMIKEVVHIAAGMAFMPVNL